MLKVSGPTTEKSVNVSKTEILYLFNFNFVDRKIELWEGGCGRWGCKKYSLSNCC